MKDITIIGGGISGLTAGIYAQLSGLQSEIYERHTIVGGQCTSWMRNGFHIDNCVHWMTGTNPKTELYQLWTDVGVLGNGQELLKHDYFLQVNIDGVKAHVWRDLNKMQDELLAIAPEEAKEIRSFIKAIKDFQAISIPALKPNEQMNFGDKIKMLSMIKALPVARKFGTMSIDDYIKRFKNPTIKALISNYLPKQYYVLATFFMYAMFTTGNADLPLGGSDMITNRMRDTYLSLGGEIHCRKKANKFVIENQRVTKVEFEDGSATETKNVICTTDPSVSFALLGETYMDAIFRKCYADKKSYPIFSEVNVYFSVETSIAHLPIMELFNCEPFEIANKKHSVLCMNNYADEPNFAPEGKGLMQILVVQYEEDYEYWNNLYTTDKEAYRQAKTALAKEIQSRLEKHYPELQGKLTEIECVTPKSFNRFTGAYKGSYMGFVQTPHVEKMTHTGIIDGLNNFHLAGQWLLTPGGLPNALITGRWAVQRLLQRENRLHDFCCKKK